MKKIVSAHEPDAAFISAKIRELRALYPFIQKRIIGKSCCGRPIYLLAIGAGEEKILISAGYHGSEWLTPLACLRFLEDICEAENRELLKARTLFFVPCVNPDGTEIALKGAASAGRYKNFAGRFPHPERWNANARGVDINHNFDAGWEILHKAEREAGITLPAPTRYGGTHPESEPETRAITALCRREKFSRALALHSQGEEIFSEYGERTPPESHILAKKMCAASGYTEVKNAGLYSHGGFKDWFIDFSGKPAFTAEIGKGKNPLPIAEFENIYAKLSPALKFFAEWEK